MLSRFGKISSNADNRSKQENVPDMADYLHEKDTRPTFDIELDMTITGEHKRRYRRAAD